MAMHLSNETPSFANSCTVKANIVRASTFAFATAVPPNSGRVQSLTHPCLFEKFKFKFATCIASALVGAAVVLKSRSSYCCCLLLTEVTHDHLQQGAQAGHAQNSLWLLLLLVDVLKCNAMVTSDCFTNTWITPLPSDFVGTAPPQPHLWQRTASCARSCPGGGIYHLGPDVREQRSQQPLAASLCLQCIRPPGQLCAHFQVGSARKTAAGKVFKAESCFK